MQSMLCERKGKSYSTVKWKWRKKIFLLANSAKLRKACLFASEVLELLNATRVTLLNDDDD